jgi:pimeloyl-ACP methyl ester carboxylesterase
MPVVGMLAALLGIWAAETVASDGSREGEVGGVVRVPCPFSVPDATGERDEVYCGRVTVPESHGRTDGPTVRVTVAVFRTPSGSPLPDPLLMLAGGPGESTFDTYAEALLSPIGSVFRAQRDLVLIELSGLFYAEPALACPEIGSALIDALGQDPHHSRGLLVRAARACRERLLARGIEFSHYNHVEAAADIAMVMTALGYDRFNLYGNSAGSELGQHVLRDFPDRVRSAVLTSVLPLSETFGTQMPANAVGALWLVFEQCEKDPECRRENPNLEDTFFRLIETLDERPVTMTLRSPFTGSDFRVHLTGQRLAQWVFALLYDTEAVHALPGFITRLAAGDHSPLEAQSGAFLVPETFSWGVHYSAECAEGGGFALEDIRLGDRYPAFAEAVADVWYGPRNLLAVCEVWGVPLLDDYVQQPVTGDVPTLLLSGALDNVTPPRYAEQVAEGLSRSYTYTYPDVAHTPISGGLCPLSMIAQFVADPTHAPDDTCIAGMTGESSIPVVRWIIPAGRTVLPDPFATRLAVLVVSTLLLLSGLVVWPVSAWRAGGARVAGLARGITAAAAGLDLLFLATFLASRPMLLFLIVLIPSSPSEVLSGYPAILRIGRWLPALSAVLALGSLGFAARVWRNRSWSTVARLHYLLVTLAVLAFAWGTTLTRGG